MTSATRTLATRAAFLAVAVLVSVGGAVMLGRAKLKATGPFVIALYVFLALMVADEAVPVRGGEDGGVVINGSAGFPTGGHRRSRWLGVVVFSHARAWSPRIDRIGCAW